MNFVQLLACGVATWAAVFVIDMAMRRGYDTACLESGGLILPSQPAHLAGGKGVRLSAVIAWLAGTGVDLLFTASPLFTGPLAVGIFRREQPWLPPGLHSQCRPVRGTRSGPAPAHRGRAACWCHKS